MKRLQFSDDFTGIYKPEDGFKGGYSRCDQCGRIVELFELANVSGEERDRLLEEGNRCRCVGPAGRIIPWAIPKGCFHIFGAERLS